MPPTKSLAKRLVKNNPHAKQIVSETSLSNDSSDLSNVCNEIIEGEIEGPTGQYGSDVEEMGLSINLRKREEYKQMIEERIARLPAQFAQTKIGLGLPEEAPEVSDGRKLSRITDPTLVIKKGLDLKVLRNFIKLIPEYQVELKADLHEDLILLEPTLSVCIRAFVPQKIIDETFINRLRFGDVYPRAYH